MATIDAAKHEARLAELVAGLTGEDAASSAEMTHSLLSGAADPLAVVARAIIDLRESDRALRVTRYLDRGYQPVIDLREPEARPAFYGARPESDPPTDDEIDLRFRRHARVPGARMRATGDRPAGNSGFVPA